MGASNGISVRFQSAIYRLRACVITIDLCLSMVSSRSFSGTSDRSHIPTRIMNVSSSWSIAKSAIASVLGRSASRPHQSAAPPPSLMSTVDCPCGHRNVCSSHRVAIECEHQCVVYRVRIDPAHHRIAGVALVPSSLSGRGRTAVSGRAPRAVRDSHIRPVFAATMRCCNDPCLVVFSRAVRPSRFSAAQAAPACTCGYRASSRRSSRH